MKHGAPDARNPSIRKSVNGIPPQPPLIKGGLERARGRFRRLLVALLCVCSCADAQARVLFLAHYDGETANADHAAGNPVTRSAMEGLTAAGTTAKGKWGGALDLTDPKRTGAYSALHNLDPRRGTVDFWYRFDAIEGTTYSPLFGWYRPPTQPGGRKKESAFEVYRYGNSLVLGVHQPYVQSTGVIQPDTDAWHHVAITWNCMGGDGHSEYNVFLDGKSAARLTGAVALKKPGGALHVGIWDYAWGQHLRGRVDELRITDQVEYLTNFTPPARPHFTPGTPAALAQSFRAAMAGITELRADAEMVSAVMGPDSGAADSIREAIDHAVKSFESLTKPLRDRIDSDANAFEVMAGVDADVIARLGLDLAPLHERAEQLNDAQKQTRQSVAALLGARFQQVPRVYNESIISLGYLREETEGLRRAIFYRRAIRDTSAAMRVVDEVAAFAKETDRRLKQARDAFHDLFADAPGARYDPVPSIPAFTADRRKCHALQGIWTSLTEITSEIRPHRTAIGKARGGLRPGSFDRRLRPRFQPAPLPPVAVEPDGTLKRLIFAGSFGRAETMTALEFDTISEESPSVTWPARDRFEVKENPAIESQWSRFRVPLSDTVLLYAVGDMMYRPSWFADEFEDGPEYYFTPNGVGSTGFDYRHPVPRRHIQQYLEEAARIHGARPYTFIYKGPWEAHPYRGTSVHVPGHRTTAFMEHGFSEIAVKAFRSYLEKKFGSIDGLNAAWRTRYENFDSIQPPDPLLRAFVITEDERGQDVYTVHYPNKRLPGAPTTGLSYEFERCRKDLYADYLEDCYRAIKRGDPTRPLASSTSGGIMNEILINSLDDVLMAEDCVDMWGKHPSGGYGWVDSPYMWGMNRYFKKTLVSLEYYGWAQEEIGDDFWPTFELAPGTTDELVYHSGRRDVWHEFSWDRRMLLFYWTQKTVELPEGFRPATSPMVRPWAHLFPVMKRRTTRLNEIFIEAGIVEPRIAVLHPGVSIINAYPYNSAQKITRDILDRLLARQYHFGFVPEQFIVNGRDRLDRYDVLILPYVPYFDDGFGEKLLEWVRDGGTLIAAGPFGLYGKHGAEYEHGATKVFADTKFSYPTPEGRTVDWAWRAERQGSPVTEPHLVAPYGKGKVMLTLHGRALQRSGAVAAEPHVGIEIGARIVGEQGKGAKQLRKDDRIRPGHVEAEADFTPPVRAFYQLLQDCTRRKAWVTEGNIEMVLRRKDEDGPLYMSLLNWNYRAAQETRVNVRGAYPDVMDLTLGEGFPVEATVEGDRTSFEVRLGPGEGVMLALR
ncbi:MAG: hypothetical protein CMJ18_09255 [Phycisphaeraceae bacterium]|nr:hypothetical protein [Phycisphaeraceae bacterium]